ncbi:hypothetical protein [Marinomonas arctica]|uniref:hypothetical protein n=1 Tax=Marinomonas TaxID=28253 RepID=UPI003570EF73
MEFLVNELNIHRNTASKYLNQLVEIGVLTKHKLGRDNYYLNTELFNLFTN